MKEADREKNIVQNGEWWKCHDLLAVKSLRMKPPWNPLTTNLISGLVGLTMDIRDHLGPGPHKMVELGSWSGESASVFAGSRLFEPLWLIDLWLTPAIEGVCEYNMAKFGERVIMMQGDLYKIGEDWNEPLDVIYLDADHSLEATRRVLPLWYKHIKPGGIMAGHDYNKKCWPGVVQGVDEFFGAQNIKVYEDSSWMIRKPLD